MKKSMVAICLVATASALVGCNAHVYSPPARVSALESAKPVAEGEISGGAAVGTLGSLFGVETTNFTVRARRGVTEHSEVGLDLNLMKIDNSQAAADIDPHIWSARVGGKWAPELLGDHVALIYGLGGGTSDGGPFVSPDVGAVLAFENRYLVPFASVNGFVSEPIDARPVDVSNQDQDVGTNVQTPSRTWGVTFAGGLKLPISWGNTTVAPIVGLSESRITDGEEDTRITGASIGLDVAFQ